jgi:hypothetical protein
MQECSNKKFKDIDEDEDFFKEKPPSYFIKPKGNSTFTF